ncbi:MAG: tRNA (adenosine(37)-N6)-threonylcarbamoyltransferase complex ATPase subunit type 1 TsaE, partial [Alistipes sp.]|nr:tRNA (adenosine(37)-N6)-threonylcarbamoyltransferase complex ATPase subunit type 1 TsaE [Alistipes sp.]
MKTISIHSEEELPEVADALLDALNGRTVVALRGEMGAGKTTLIRAVADALGVEDQVTSPTFALVNQYEGANGERLFHFDFYRI